MKILMKREEKKKLKKKKLKKEKQKNNLKMKKRQLIYHRDSWILDSKSLFWIGLLYMEGIHGLLEEQLLTRYMWIMLDSKFSKRH